MRNSVIANFATTAADGKTYGINDDESRRLQYFSLDYLPVLESRAKYVVDVLRRTPPCQKKLTAYFSASGVTAKAAKTLAEAAGTDLFGIKPAVPYTDADLNWQDKNSRSSVEMKDLSYRPEIAEKLPNIEEYDTIFVGFPIWWYIAPTIINTFLESYDFSGKKIVLFATSGDSGFGKTAKKLADSCKSAKLITGKLLNGRFDRDELAQWANSL